MLIIKCNVKVKHHQDKKKLVLSFLWILLLYMQKWLKKNTRKGFSIRNVCIYILHKESKISTTQFWSNLVSNILPYLCTYSKVLQLWVWSWISFSCVYIICMTVSWSSGRAEVDVTFENARNSVDYKTICVNMICIFYDKKSKYHKTYTNENKMCLTG